MILTKPAEFGMPEDISETTITNLNLLAAVIFSLLVIHFAQEMPQVEDIRTQMLEGYEVMTAMPLGAQGL